MKIWIIGGTKDSRNILDKILKNHIKTLDIKNSTCYNTAKF